MFNFTLLIVPGKFAGCGSKATKGLLSRTQYVCLSPFCLARIYLRVLSQGTVEPWLMRNPLETRLNIHAVHPSLEGQYSMSDVSGTMYPHSLYVLICPSISSCITPYNHPLLG